MHDLIDISIDWAEYLAVKLERKVQGIYCEAHGSGGSSNGKAAAAHTNLSIALFEIELLEQILTLVIRKSNIIRFFSLTVRSERVVSNTVLRIYGLLGNSIRYCSKVTLVLRKLNDDGRKEY